MKKKHLYMLTAVALTTISCSNEIPTTQPVSDNAIRIVANIAPQTRAPQLTTDGSGSFSQGDKMSLFIAEGNANQLSVKYEYGSGILTWGSLGLSESNSEVTLAACYPQQEEIQDGTFEFNALTAPEKDLLLAPAQTVTAGTSEAVHLTFNHALHRLDLAFTLGNSYTDEDLASLTVNLTAKTTCVVDGVQGKIKEVKATTGEYTSTKMVDSFYLVPQATTDIVLNIRIGDDKKSLTLSDLLKQLNASQTELISGNRCKLTLKVSREGITVEDGSINAWGDQVTADGEVVIG